MFLIQVYNFQEKIDAEAANIKPIDTAPTAFGWKNYHHLETIYAWLDHLLAKHGNILTPLDVGKSYEGIPLRGVKLSNKKNNTGIVVEGTIHAREW